MTTTSHTSVHAAPDQLSERIRAASPTMIAVALIACELAVWHLVIQMALSQGLR
ncbi:MAG TPA: hypothetical protein VM684_19705 [Gaiellales bacterium]|jgi:hypothetical protein|nr:hypothetical protein [Gaiellales bacterium]HVI38474.1 hypothetical protein [Gaiellales bacterium]